MLFLWFLITTAVAAVVHFLVKKLTMAKFFCVANAALTVVLLVLLLLHLLYILLLLLLVNEPFVLFQEPWAYFAQAESDYI